MVAKAPWLALTRTAVVHEAALGEVVSHLDSEGRRPGGLLGKEVWSNRARAGGSASGGARKTTATNPRPLSD